MADFVLKRPLTPRQQTAVAALLTSSNKEEAAEKARVSARTLTRWLADPEFQAALRQAQDAALAQTYGRLAGEAAEAVKVLAAVAGDTNAAPGARVSAARVILDQLLRFAELTALAERVAALEEAFDGD